LLSQTLKCNDYERYHCRLTGVTAPAERDIPYKTHFAHRQRPVPTPARRCLGVPLIKEVMANGELFRAHVFELACQQRHRAGTTKSRHLSKGQVERMNRTIKAYTSTRVEGDYPVRLAQFGPHLEADRIILNFFLTGLSPSRSSSRPMPLRCSQRSKGNRVRVEIVGCNAQRQSSSGSSVWRRKAMTTRPRQREPSTVVLAGWSAEEVWIFHFTLSPSSG
jgi:hypothetical protein